jgi:DNA-binding transcriptional LysR family regulator
METQLLRTFLAVVEAGSISGAAAQLGYVQSSVSEQIQRLERELGAALLARSSTGVVLTGEGRRAVIAAERVLAALDELQVAAGGPRRLRVGSVDTLAVQWLPDVLAALPADERPTIAMDRRDRLLRALLESRCDVVLLYRPRGGSLPRVGARREALDRLEVEVLDTDELVVVVAPEWNADDVDGGWLVTQPGCVHREVFDRHVAPQVAGLHVHAEAPTPDALRRLARQGAGRAMLPRLAVADDLAHGGLVVDPSAPDVGGAIEIVAVHRRDAGPEVHRFLRRAVDRALASSEAAEST